MATSEARIAANRQNAAKSTGPKTEEGKEISRRNALKHGMTGGGIVVPVEDEREVAERYAAFVDELKPSTAVALTLVRRAATLAVRMERCAERERANTEERVVEAMNTVEIPEGADQAQAAKLMAEAGRHAAFDTSKEANLARRYEAAAERGFFRALKEFRLVEKQTRGQEESVAPDRQAEIFRQELGSFLQMSKLDNEFDRAYPEMALPSLKNRLEPAFLAPESPLASRVDVPITIGRAR